MAEKTASCVEESLFYEKLESLKASRKGKQSDLTVFLNDEFYDRAIKEWLTTVDSREIEGLTKNDVATIKRKKWTLATAWKNCNSRWEVPCSKA